MSTRNRLEERYRRVLRLLPAAYRRVWEEDMVAVFLATMRTDDPEYQADYGRPPWPEVASVAWLAVRLRIGTAGAPPPRYVAWGAALRLAALCVLFSHAALALDQAGFQAWLSGRLPLLPAPPAEWSQGLATGPWTVALNAAGILWLPAFATLVAGHWRAARVLAAVALVVPAMSAVASTGIAIAGGPQPFLAMLWAGVALDVLLVVALAAFEADPAPRRRSWLLALPVAAAAAGAGMFVAPVADAAVLFDWPGLSCAAVVAGAAVHALRGPGRDPDWTHALAVLAGTALALRLVTLVDYATRPGWATGDTVLLGLAECAAVFAVLLPLRRSTRRRLHALS
ncbi:hypothetical protein [Dactylosporangium darangshiense]|uniref:Integral membrane protein n=1 Tax=Dactylosporangium darangshiense TaxID=579108 RepID=A0ABP8D869_9ACTN